MSDELNEEMRRLREEVAMLNAHRFIQVQNSIPRLLAFNFARGLAFGLGTVVGASFLVSVVVYSLSQIDFIPVIGEWASQIADQIQTGR
jgi:Domain of unknown function (DUF5665)